VNAELFFDINLTGNKENNYSELLKADFPIIIVNAICLGIYIQYLAYYFYIIYIDCGQIEVYPMTTLHYMDLFQINR